MSLDDWVKIQPEADQSHGVGKSGVIGCYEQLYGKKPHGDQGSESMPPYKGPATSSQYLHHGDSVNSPPHYTAGGLEPIDMIEAKQLGYHLGNALKYICRCQFKGDRKTDVKKAIWYLQRYLKTIETEQ